MQHTCTIVQAWHLAEANTDGARVMFFNVTEHIFIATVRIAGALCSDAVSVRLLGLYAAAVVVVVTRMQPTNLVMIMTLCGRAFKSCCLDITAAAEGR